MHRQLIFIAVFSVLLSYSPIVIYNGVGIAEEVAPKVEVKDTIETKSFFESALGVQIAWYASILGVILGVAPLILYIQERNKSKLLNSILEKYDLALKVENEAKKASDSKTTADQAVNKSKQELAELTKQLEETIPSQARAAFFRAAIPEVDRQILYLQEQRKAMETGLKQTGVALSDSSRLQPILQTEINQTVLARRKLDEKQTILSIFAGLAGGSAAFSLFYQIITPLRIVLGIGILWAVYGLCQQWAIVYPENILSKLIRAPTWKGVLVTLLALVASVVIFVVFIVLLRRYD
jgi:hypothetical protein